MLPARRSLPRRDFILLPLVVLLTLGAMYGATEGVLRLFWTQQDVDSCKAGNGLHKPGCTVTMKVFEGPSIDYSYNSCGFRGTQSCAPAPSGATTLVVVGSSLAGGAYVPYEQTFAARLATDLTRSCGQQVVVQSPAGFVGEEDEIGQQIGPALAQKPSALILAMMPADLERFGETGAGANPAPVPVSPLWQLKALLSGSRVAQVAQYYLSGNLERYAALYLRGAKADFMRDPLTAGWQDKLARWEALIGPMAGAAHAAGVPMVLVFAPQRAQLYLLGRAAPPGIDPDLLPGRLAAMARRHGIAFVDLGKAWEGRADIDSLYYRLDGHPNALGHREMTEAIEATLLSGLVPRLDGCQKPQARRAGP